MDNQICIESEGLRIFDYYVAFTAVEDVRTTRIWPFLRKLTIVTTNSIITLRGNNRDMLATYDMIRRARIAVHEF